MENFGLCLSTSPGVLEVVTLLTCLGMALIPCCDEARRVSHCNHDSIWELHGVGEGERREVTEDHRLGSGKLLKLTSILPT